MGAGNYHIQKLNSPLQANGVSLMLKYATSTNYYATLVLLGQKIDFNNESDTKTPKGCRKLPLSNDAGATAWQGYFTYLSLSALQGLRTVSQTCSGQYPLAMALFGEQNGSDSGLG